MPTPAPDKPQDRSLKSTPRPASRPLDRTAGTFHATQIVTLPVDTQSILDPWWRIQDLWLRLRAELELRFEEQGPGRRLRICRFGGPLSPSLQALRAPARDPATYELGPRCTLVPQLDDGGADLVLGLATAQRIERWPEGPALVNELNAFLARCRG